jgi:hypothetical protein
MSVFRDVTIKWHGTDYVVTPTMRLLRRIENEQVSLTDIAVRASQGKPPVSHIALVLSVLLQSAGAPHCSEDEVFQELIEGNEKQVLALVTATLQAFSPGDESSPGKRAARARQSKSKAS